MVNDSTFNCLYSNQGDRTFDDRSMLRGYALNDAGRREQANMRIAAGTFENNRHMDLVDTTFFDDYLAVFKVNGYAISLEREIEGTRE